MRLKWTATKPVKHLPPRAATRIFRDDALLHPEQESAVGGCGPGDGNSGAATDDLATALVGQRQGYAIYGCAEMTICRRSAP